MMTNGSGRLSGAQSGSDQNRSFSRLYTGELGQMAALSSLHYHAHIRRVKNGDLNLFNLTIFDWDDTLFPTSFFTKNGLLQLQRKDLPSNVSTELRHIDSTGRKLVQAALKHGSVVIVTNALSYWVGDSGSMYLPRLYSYIRSNNIEIISAREIYEQDLRYQYTAWKVLTFQNIFSSIGAETDTFSLIAVGDQPAEHVAAKHIAATYRSCEVKIVIFQEVPDMQGLHHELCWLKEKFSEIVFTRYNCEVRYSDQPRLLISSGEEDNPAETSSGIFGSFCNTVKSVIQSWFDTFSSSSADNQ